MKTLAIALIILAFAGVSLAGSPSTPTNIDIPWMSDYDTALKKSREMNRPMIISFAGPSCSQCVDMDRDIFNTREFLRYSGKFVLYRCIVPKCKRPLSVVRSPAGGLLGAFGYSEGMTVADYKRKVDTILARDPGTKH